LTPRTAVTEGKPQLIQPDFDQETGITICMSAEVSQDPCRHQQSGFQSKTHPKLGCANVMQEHWFSPDSEEPLSPTESPKPSLAA